MYLRFYSAIIEIMLSASLRFWFHLQEQKINGRKLTKIKELYAIRVQKKLKGTEISAKQTALC